MLYNTMDDNTQTHSHDTNATSTLFAHKPHFDFSQTPTYWRDNSVLKTIFENTFSCGVPLFESFIVTTIQEIKHKITDEALKNDIEVFLKQEKNHMAAHTALNNYLISQGYPVSQYINATKKNLSYYLAQSIEKRLQIATLMESVTSIFSESYLHQSFIEQNHSAPHELLIWHAVEELDHRSIAYRVYIDILQKHKPNYFFNTFYSIRTSLMIFKFMVNQLRIQKILMKWSSWKDIFWLFGRRGPTYATFKGLINFLMPGYDPEYCYFKDKKLIKKVLKWKQDYHSLMNV